MWNQAARIAVMLHGGIEGTQGKTGLALIRYRPEQIAVVIDRDCDKPENAAWAGKSFAELTGIPVNVPIVPSLQAALAYQPTVLAIGIAPSGGVLPAAWFAEVKQAILAGLSIANGLHTCLATHPDLLTLIQTGQLQPGQEIWDIRQEPQGLTVGSAKARHLTCKRVLTVGTDMSIGKMSTSLEMDRRCRQRGLRSQFLGTGQAGIMISGAGIPLDAVRVDFASGAIEQLVLQADPQVDILHIEGQGSLLNPASTATLPLLRGSQPTHLILVHRAGQTAIRNFPEVTIPPLKAVIELYEAVAAAAGSFIPGKVAAIALNTYHLDQGAAQQAVEMVIHDTDLPCIDPVRFSPDPLVDAILKS
ncbi:MAG: DUF1611 domain-containing protein [Synechococcales bacterium]|nr:DUF1611 domain-containing protein [Synechococcales bacterium]